MKFYNSTHNFYRIKNSLDSSEEIIKNIKSDYCNGILDHEYINNIDADKVISTFDSYNKNTEISELEVVKNEEFGFFLGLEMEKDSHINIGDFIDLPWWGLSEIYRVKVESGLDNLQVNLVDYVIDDSGIYIADRILNSKSNTYKSGFVPIFITGKIPPDLDSDKIEIKVTVYKSNKYDEEKMIESKIIKIKIIDYIYDSEIEDSFFLDLWQHPCSWARLHGVNYFSDDHFIVIEKHLKSMKKLGQKVVNLIVSDFPWAGQKCFAIDKNPSRLYEYNMVKVIRKNCKLKFDFSILDKYIDTCLKVGIDKEINIFGILGNWHGYDFGSPIPDYNDPIRIRIFDRDKNIYDYIRSIDELKEYISSLFDHLDKRGLIPITKIIGDEPGSPEKFEEYKNFIDSSANKNLNYKYAVHSNNFIENFKGDVDSFSLNTIVLSDVFEGRLKNNNITDNLYKLTWYSCCFPEKFNTFIKSPLIEARYMGVYTYLWNMKGMLRWAYGIYVDNIDNDIRYKPAKWAAGDMFFVYPGKNGTIEHSIREKNLLYGIQDYNIFKNMENTIKLNKNTNELLKIDSGIKNDNNCVSLKKYTDINEYTKNRNHVIKLYKQCI